MIYSLFRAYFNKIHHSFVFINRGTLIGPNFFAKTDDSDFL
jgi:hypothetical protein